MIQVLEIIAIKPNSYRLLISKDNQEESLIVSENLLVKNNLLSPREISEKEYTQISKVISEDVIYEKALHFIDYKMRSISEVKKHLLKSTKDDNVISKIVKRLKENQYLNDDFYVKTYINEKIDFDLVGPRYIKDKLIQKGIHYDLIRQNMDIFTSEMQYEKIVELIKKETRYPIKSPLKKAYASLKMKLVNKGFDLNIVDSALLSNVDLLESVIDEESLLEKEMLALRINTKDLSMEDRNKIIKKLMGKGYDYTLIKKQMKG